MKQGFRPRQPVTETAISICGWSELVDIEFTESHPRDFSSARRFPEAEVVEVTANQRNPDQRRDAPDSNLSRLRIRFDLRQS